MDKLGWNWLFGTAFILSVGTLGGWAIAEKLFGHGAGIYFAYLGTCTCIALMMLKISVYGRAKELLYYRLLFLGYVCLDLAWFFNCLFFTLFLVERLDFSVKAATLLLHFYICFANVFLAIRNFDEKWALIEKDKFNKFMKKGSSHVAWEELVKSMKLEAIFFLPGIPQKFNELLSVFVAASFFMGGIVSPAHPILRIASLGISVSLCSACILQVSVYRFAEARKLASIEKDKNIIIKSDS